MTRRHELRCFDDVNRPFELTGSYDPPLGLLGDAIDAIALHRIAEESVRRFITDIASYLRAELPVEPVPGDAGERYPMATD